MNSKENKMNTTRTQEVIDAEFNEIKSRSKAVFAMNDDDKLAFINSHYKMDFGKLSVKTIQALIKKDFPNDPVSYHNSKSKCYHAICQFIFYCELKTSDEFRPDPTITNQSVAPSKPKKSGKALTIICSNPDDLDLIIIKGGAPEPIPIVKIQPCVEQTPIEKPILRDSKYDAVIAEINAGVCSLDSAIRINKYILKVHTYINKTTGVQTSNLEIDKRFGCCPHDNIWDGGKKYTYTVGNIFGETKLEVTPDGQIIYDKTYFKGKDKQRYFATRWFERPEYSHWTNCYLYANRGYHLSGVEVLGMRGKHLTKDGKYKYEGVSIADLKEACKKNGIKCFSGKDKHELVKLLMKI